MPRARRQLALTPELVARAYRPVKDSGPPPDFLRTNEADWEKTAHDVLFSRPDGEGLWIFAYGSLLWNPEFEHVDKRIGRARGWHRSFCLNLPTWRGTLERPGLMMALDRGGQCSGMVYRLPEEDLVEQLIRLMRREMPVKHPVKPPTNSPRWLRIETEEGSLPAIAFVANRKGHSYAGRLTVLETADILASACGHGGSCAEYLYNTIVHLEACGFRDSYLWRLQSLVAERLAGVPGPSAREGVEDLLLGEHQVGEVPGEG